MLDVRLFERLPHGMEPTIYGETMIRHARMAVTSLSLAHDDMVALRSGLVGQVEIGVIMTPAMALVPRAIANVKRNAPKAAHRRACGAVGHPLEKLRRARSTS